jgi:hypothetical protein
MPDRPLYYDRAGNPIALMEWAALFDDHDIKVVAYTEIGPYRVSTVWLGLDHSWGHGPPLIFETMVFGPESAGGYDMDCRRYSTEEQARAGHDETVTLVRATTASLEDVTADEEVTRTDD